VPLVGIFFHAPIIRVEAGARPSEGAHAIQSLLFIETGSTPNLSEKVPLGSPLVQLDICVLSQSAGLPDQATNGDTLAR
jgi:hypothetical protein